MTARNRAGFVAVGFVGGIAAGTFLWSSMQRSHKRHLFSPHAVRRLAALSYLSSRSTVNTARILREYVAWEPRSLLRERGERILSRVEAAL